MPTKKLLMCPPTYFDIEYEINVWMHTENQVVPETARQQWDQLHALYKKLGYQIELVDQVQGLPDMVFATDSCLIVDGRVMLSNFRYPERQPETTHFESWLRSAGYSDIARPKHLFEGGGDALVCGDLIFVGYGFRSDVESHAELDAYFDRSVVSLRLVDPSFYHLDTAFAVLDKDTVAYYPGAFDETSRRAIELSVPNTIEATLEEARGFGLNAVSDGHNVVTSNESASLLHKYQEAGYKVHGTPILEFRKSGGGVKCLTLELRD
jgi:N-dimethylarginine dimethylaminohydrolase